MLFCHCPLERQLSRLQSLLEKIDQKIGNAHYTGARQMYTKALMEAAKAQSHSGHSDRAVRLSIVKHHGKAFDKLGQGQLIALRQRASAHNSKKIETLEESRAHVLAQVELLRARQHEDSNSGLINHMDSIRFCPEEFDRFAELWPQYTAKEDSSRLLAPPQGIPPFMEQLLNEQTAKGQFLPSGVKPDWLPYMVDLRDAFAGTGFYADSTHPTGDVIYKLVLAIAQPRRVMFLECHRSRRGLSSMTAYGCYEYEACRFVPHTLVPWKDSSDIWVVPEVHVRASEVHTAGEPVPWAVFTRYFKKPGPERKEKQDGSSDSRKDSQAETLRLLQVEYPWLSLEELQEMLTQHVHRPAPGAAGPGGASCASSSSTQQQQPQPEDLPEDIVVQMNADLELIRAEVAEGHAGAGSFFRLKALGGEWSVKLFKKLTTDFGSYAKDKSIAKWCALTNFPERKSFAVNRYGMANSRMLAEEVVRRGDFFLGAWVDAGSPSAYDFHPLVAAYRSTAEYEQWFDDLPLDSWSSKAGFALRDLVPLPIVD